MWIQNNNARWLWDLTSWWLHVLWNSNAFIPIALSIFLRKEQQVLNTVFWKGFSQTLNAMFLTIFYWTCSILNDRNVKRHNFNLLLLAMIATHGTLAGCVLINSNSAAQFALTVIGSMLVSFCGFGIVWSIQIFPQNTFESLQRHMQKHMQKHI